MTSVTRVLFASTICCSLAFISSCSKQIPPYDGSNSSNLTDAQDIQYNTGQTGIITEEIGPQAESLASTGSSIGTTDSFDLPPDQSSEEYKMLYGRSSRDLKPIYFDFDQASISSNQIPILESNGDYLKNNPSAKVAIEGNCDERGTNEYNIALGERRALNAKNYLIQLGIETYRLRTISYGEERPLFNGNDESSWSRNRRDDFILE